MGAVLLMASLDSHVACEVAACNSVAEQLLSLQLSGMSQLKGQNATYRNQLGTLRSENATLQRKTSDLARQLSDVQGSPVRILSAWSERWRNVLNFACRQAE